MSKDLNPTKALIFRIIHRENMPWVFANGLHCKNSETIDPGYIPIGNADLIGRRGHRPVPCAPGGNLGDYVPFYFTPWSPMMFNIVTGRGGVRQRNSDEIVILVSSLHALRKNGVHFLFTDRHAYLEAAEYYADLGKLDQIPWALLQKRDFQRDPDNPKKFESYQAEALIYRALPIGGLLGVVCYDDSVRGRVAAEAANHHLTIPVITKRSWYF